MTERQKINISGFAFSEKYIMLLVPELINHQSQKPFLNNYCQGFCHKLTTFPYSSAILGILKWRSGFGPDSSFKLGWLLGIQIVRGKNASH